MEQPDKIKIEVAFALPDEQVIVSVSLDKGATVEDAIERSGLLERYKQIDLETSKVGVFGKLAKLDKELREGDRVEIYRPLIADPKEVRRKRAAEGKVTKKGAGSES